MAKSYRLMVKQFLISTVDPHAPSNAHPKHRPGGPWSDDDYNVFDGDRHVGRIMWTHAAPDDHTSVLDDHGASAAVPA